MRPRCDRLLLAGTKDCSWLFIGMGLVAPAPRIQAKSFSKGQGAQQKKESSNLEDETHAVQSEKLPGHVNYCFGRHAAACSGKQRHFLAEDVANGQKISRGCCT